MSPLHTDVCAMGRQALSLLVSLVVGFSPVAWAEDDGAECRWLRQ